VDIPLRIWWQAEDAFAENVPLDHAQGCSHKAQRDAPAVSQWRWPGAVRTATKAAQRGNADGFEVVAREWFEKFKPNWAHLGALTERAHYPSMGG
jgi:hypothetical protein